MLKTFKNNMPCPPAKAKPDQPDCQYEGSQKISAINEDNYRVEGRNSRKAQHHHEGQNPQDAHWNEHEHPPEQCPQAFCMLVHMPLTPGPSGAGPRTTEFKWNPQCRSRSEPLVRRRNSSAIHVSG
jgi:hypothetical protein